jgi:hypothetical protein
MTVESNSESEKDMQENFDSEPKPKDGEPGDQDAEKAKAAKDERSDAAKKLGKAGGEAAAKAKKAKAAQPEPEVKADAKPDDTDTDEGKKPLGHRREDPRARVMDATRKAREAQERADALEARLAKLEAGQKPEGEKPSGDEEPQQDQFNTWEEYSRAVTRWEVRQGISEEVQELTAKQREEQEEGRKLEAVKQKAQEFYGRLDEALQADPEFYNRVDPGLVKVTPSFLLAPGQSPSPESDVMQAIVDSEHAAALLLHLSEHPDEMDKLRALPDTFSVFRAMGRLEARVGGEPAPKAEPKPEDRPVSQAKPPVRPLTGSPQHSEEDVGEDTPFEDHLRIYNAQDARARRGR